MLGNWRQYDGWIQNLTIRQMIRDAVRTLQGVQLKDQFFTGSEIAQAVIDVYKLTQYWVGRTNHNKHPSGISDEDWIELFQGARRSIEDLLHVKNVKIEEFPKPLSCEYCATWVSEGIRAGARSFCSVCATVADTFIAGLQQQEREVLRQEEAEAARDVSGRNARRVPTPMRTAEEIRKERATRNTVG